MEREALRQELAAITADATKWVQQRRVLGEAKVWLERPLPPGRGEEPSTATPPPELSLPAESAPNANPQPPWAPSLEAFYVQVRGCRRCGLAAKRQHLVFGEGDPRARLAFVGEAPGADEDAQGRPFVGAAGQLLDKIIIGMGLRRSQVYICNLIKCRPPFNRDPEEAEVAACRPYLEQQLALLKPRVIVALGRHAAQALTGSGEGIGKLRGQDLQWQGALLVPTYHPSALLRDERLKRPVWEDMKRVLKALEAAQP
jgi:DNA polymerase